MLFRIRMQNYYCWDKYTRSAKVPFMPAKESYGRVLWRALGGFMLMKIYNVFWL